MVVQILRVRGIRRVSRSLKGIEAFVGVPHFDGVRSIRKGLHNSERVAQFEGIRVIQKG